VICLASDQRVLRDGEYAETVLSEMKGLGRVDHAPPRKDRGGVQVRSQFFFGGGELTKSHCVQAPHL
jgi:hypothetical protein